MKRKLPILLAAGLLIPAIPLKATTPESCYAKTIAGCALLSIGIYNAVKAVQAFDSQSNTKEKLKKDLQNCHIGMGSKADHYFQKLKKSSLESIKRTLIAIASGITGGFLIAYGLVEK